MLKDREELDKMLKDAGLFTITQILDGTPMDSMHVCAEVVDLKTFGQWLSVQREKFLSTKARLELANKQYDEIYEWIMAHSAVFHSVSLNFKAAVKSEADIRQECLQEVTDSLYALSKTYKNNDKREGVQNAYAHVVGL